MRAAASVALVLLALGCSRSSTITQDAPATPSAVTTPSTAASAEPKNAADAAQDTGIRIVVASQDADALSLVRTERLRAKAEGRVLVVYAGASWCEPR